MEDPALRDYRCRDMEMELFMNTGLPDSIFPKDWWLDARSRSGIPRTLHRVSGIAGRTLKLIGVVVRIGRTIGGVVQRMIPPALLSKGGSILIIGPPNSGKTTILP